MARFYRAHSQLGGRTAADLAAGGIHLWSHADVEPLDVDGFLEALGDEYHDPGDDVWGGANIEVGNQFDDVGLADKPAHTYSGS